MKNYNQFKLAITIQVLVIFLMMPTICSSQFVIKYKEPKEPQGNIYNYNAWVKSTDHPRKIKGQLLGIDDNDQFVFQQKRSNEILHLEMSNIEKVKFRKEGSVWKGILTGSLTGLATGAIMGYAMGDDRCCSDYFVCFFVFTKEEKALMNGLAMSIPGAIIGGLLGSVKVKRSLGMNRKQNLRSLREFY